MALTLKQEHQIINAVVQDPGLVALVAQLIRGKAAALSPAAAITNLEVESLSDCLLDLSGDPGTGCKKAGCPR